MKKDEQAVQDLILCIMISMLICLMIVSLSFAHFNLVLLYHLKYIYHLWDALEQGEKQSNDILKKWVFSKELSLKERITINKRLSLATTPINNIKTCSNGVEMERNVLTMVIVSAERNDLITLESVLVKRISEEKLMVLWEKLQRASCFSRVQDILCLKFL